MLLSERSEQSFPQRQQCKLCLRNTYASFSTPTIRAVFALLILCLFLLRIILQNQLPFLVSGYPRPPCLESLLTRIESRERMRFCVQHDLIER